MFLYIVCERILTTDITINRRTNAFSHIKKTQVSFFFFFYKDNPMYMDNVTSLTTVKSLAMYLWALQRGYVNASRQV